MRMTGKLGAATIACLISFGLIGCVQLTPAERAEKDEAPASTEKSPDASTETAVEKTVELNASAKRGAATVSYPSEWEVVTDTETDFRAEDPTGWAWMVLNCKERSLEGYSQDDVDKILLEEAESVESLASFDGFISEPYIGELGGMRGVLFSVSSTLSGGDANGLAFIGADEKTTYIFNVFYTGPTTEPTAQRVFDSFKCDTTNASTLNDTDKGTSNVDAGGTTNKTSDPKEVAGIKLKRFSDMGISYLAPSNWDKSGGEDAVTYEGDGMLIGYSVFDGAGALYDEPASDDPSTDENLLECIVNTMGVFKANGNIEGEVHISMFGDLPAQSAVYNLNNNPGYIVVLGGFDGYKTAVVTIVPKDTDEEAVEKCVEVINAICPSIKKA
ncbi:hypothetical protein [Adlercreutzia caecimuris]|uniref:hypothetical protein n=1 Tax=Adlercreutzia caecimuris TaxID=671266 RepID=UPI00258D257E|nr:hypothetical protein [Adlercreutzia caecimuris]